MSGRVKIKGKPAKDDDYIFRVIKERFGAMEKVRDLIDTASGGTVQTRLGSGFVDVPRGGWLHLNYIAKLEEELGRKLSFDLVDKYLKR